MLTHDLQPIIDFIVNKKPTTGSVSASFLQNKDGVIVEQDITEGDIKSLPIILDENSKNGALPMLHRLACLRKLLEHMPRSTNSDLAYDILSSLFHIRPKPTHHDEVLTALTPEETKLGEEFIKLYIGDFDYNLYSSKIFAKENILKSFMSESNSYFRLQTFRVLLVAFDLRKMIDDALLKYIDEQMHIENDYMFALNYMKYDIVPSYVIPKCLSFLKAQRVIS
jgi:hypothetical protein